MVRALRDGDVTKTQVVSPALCATERLSHTYLLMPEFWVVEASTVTFNLDMCAVPSSSFIQIIYLTTSTLSFQWRYRYVVVSPPLGECEPLAPVAR